MNKRQIQEGYSYSTDRSSLNNAVLPENKQQYISPVYKYSEENIVSQDPDPCNTNKEEKQNSPSSLSSSENNSGFANTKINCNHD